MAAAYTWLVDAARLALSRSTGGPMKMHAKILLAGALLLSCFAVQAGTDTADQQTAGQAEAARTAAAQDHDANCLRYTGSLIVASENQRSERKGTASDAGAAKPKCNASPGRSYTQDDIRRTGAIDLADALRRLDPAVH
jgi:hypothetical protein